MKTKILLIALLANFSIFGQTKKLGNALADSNKTVVNYTDEIGNNKSTAIYKNALSNSEKTIYNNYLSLINGKLDSIPKVLLSVSSVSIQNGNFSVVGVKPNGQSISIPKNISDLSTTIKVTGTNISQAVAYSNFAAFVLSYTGSGLVTLYAPFGTNSVIINGINYSGSTYDDFKQAGGVRVIIVLQLCSDLLNQ